MSEENNQTFFQKQRRFWHPINIYNNLKKLYFAIIPKGSRAYDFTYGFLRVFLKRLHLFNIYYQEWIRRFDTLDDQQRKVILDQIHNMPVKPKFSVIMPVYNPNLTFFEQAIQSVLDQLYPHWELCIADDASTDPRVSAIIEAYARQDNRIKYILREENGHISAASNSALALANHPYIALLDHDDELHPLALYHVAQTIQSHPDCAIIYTDEDKITKRGRRLDPYFKPEFDYELLLSQNMVSHLGVYRRDLVMAAGAFRVGLEGSQDYDLLLRVLDLCEPDQVHHIPKPLYHWRISHQSVAQDLDIKPYAVNAGLRALQEHLKRRQVDGEIQFLPKLAAYKVTYPVPEPAPSVSLIILAGSNSETLRNCVSSILANTAYPNYQIILGMLDSETERPIFSLQDSEDGKVRIISSGLKENGTFAQVVNQITTEIDTDYICMIDPSLTGFKPDWLSTLLGQSAQPGIGAVAPRIIRSDRRVFSNGIILVPEQVFEHLSRGEEQAVNGYFGWAKLTRGYSALSPMCLLLSRQNYQTAGTLDEAFMTPTAVTVDLCLRLREAGLRNVLRPMVELYIQDQDNRHLEEEGSLLEGDKALLQKRWHRWVDNDPAFNPNLTIIDEGKVLVNLSPNLDIE